MPYSLAIFDLDGTLADSFPWFLRTINDVADRFGFRRVAGEDVEGLRHASTREILSRLEVPLWKLPAIARHARRLKAEAAAEIPLFAGVEAMLRALTEDGVQLALVTSDSEANAREKLGEAAALFSHFDCAASLFGKPAKFRRVIRRAGVDPSHVIAIGDEVRDIEAARAVGIACGAVCWGYAAPAALRAREPDFLFHQIEDILHTCLKRGSRDGEATMPAASKPKADISAVFDLADSGRETDIARDKDEMIAKAIRDEHSSEHQQKRQPRPGDDRRS
ncbi:phosphoglycolate phosphatase [Bradyrhizobium sp. LM2.7]